MDEEEKFPIEQSPNLLKEAWEFIKVILMALVIVIPIRYFITQPFIVRGASMEPNFEDKEYLIIDEISYYFRNPQRGEAVVFRYPKNPGQFFIKRVIALPGETVEVRDGSVRISHGDSSVFTLQEPYLPSGLETVGSVKLTLRHDEFFVLGDNRNFSFDSRQWGVLPKKFLIGRTFFRAWPVTRFGLVAKMFL